MTDTRALLLTDVVDSTRLSEALGDAAMAALWARHDRVARDLLPAHRGREIDKTDGFLMLFGAAADAVAYAVAYHRALAPLGLKARAGLHVGPVILTENAPRDVALGAKPLEVDGLAKPTAARVMGVAVGGQTLLTAEARAALGPTSLRVASHGRWRMKGVAQPVELFEVGDADAPFTPPPDGAKVYRVVEVDGLWLPAAQIRHGLPRERDGFVGREEDLQALAGRMDDGAALVSLVGPGGTGKTRLAVRFAWTWLGEWPGGAWFCDLSEARDAEGIASAVARALEVPLGPGDPIVQLGHAIAGRGRCLVVLDNFEQVARFAAGTLGRWLDRPSEARFLVTTREVLGLQGEASVLLEPLPEPEAAKLFVQRAQLAQRGFAPTEGDAAAIGKLVRLLDGLPLAIELAAARIRLLPPQALLDRMTERFRWLTSSGGRDARQSTLRATLDWSWGLLSEPERQALAQLSVFAGGFTLEAAEGVLALGPAHPGEEPPWAFDVVQALVDKSLVRRVGDAARLDLLLSVQEYAAEHLRSEGRFDGSGAGALSEAGARHGAWFAALAEVAQEVDAAELENLVAACRRAVQRRDVPTAVSALEGAWRVLERTGPFATGIALAEAVAGVPEPDSAARARVDAIAGTALAISGRGEEARRRYDAALIGHRAFGDRRREGVVLQGLGNLHLQEGRGAEARALFDAALVAHREVGHRRAEALVLVNLGSFDRAQGRLDEARGRLDAGLAAARAAGDRIAEGNALGTLAALSFGQGRIEEARAGFEGALSLFRAAGNRRGEAVVRCNLATLYTEAGRISEARAQYEAALTVVRETGARVTEGLVQANFGALDFEVGRTAEALARFEAALAITREVRDRVQEGVLLGNLGTMYAEEGRLEEARTHLEAARALHMEGGRRRSLGIVLGNLAAIDALEGRPQEARARYDAALAIHRELGDRRLEGIELRKLGLLHAQQGQPAEANACLATSEGLLRASGDQLELGKLWVARAESDHLAGASEAARAALAEARAIATEHGVRPESELGRALSRMEASLAESG